MRKGTQEKANNIYRAVAGVGGKPGEESWNHMVSSFEHPGEKFIFSSESNGDVVCQLYLNKT